jgi:hypothetical protein
MIKLIKEFLAYRNMVKSFDIRKMDEKLKAKIAASDDSYEKEINEVLLYNLARKMIEDDIPFDFASWFKTALLLRNTLKLQKISGIDK